MLCVQCPHCQQIMSTPEDAAGEAVVCPACQKNLQVPPNAPHLPKHLEPGGAGIGPQPAAVAAAGSPYGRAGAAVAAPPAPTPATAAMLAPASSHTRQGVPKMLYVLGGLALVAVGGVVLFAVTQTNRKPAVKPKKSSSPMVRIDDTPTPPDPLNPDHLDAANLFKAYWDNQLAADNNFKDREVTLTGYVESVGRGGPDLIVNLYGGGRRDLTKRIKCLFAPKYKDELANLVPNKKVRIRGTCQGKIEGQVVLKDCQCFDP